MNDHRFSNSNVDQPRAQEPKKLHKPQRSMGDLKPEQVIPYVDECDDPSLTAETPA